MNGPEWHNKYSTCSNRIEMINQQQSPRWKSPDRDRVERERERERERLALEEQEHERRREASKLLVNVGSHPYMVDGQNMPRDRYV